MIDEKTIESKEAIRKRLVNIGNLPSIPHVISEVSQLLDDDRTSASQLCKIISRDQAIVTKVLAVANSPLYGLPRRVSTVEFAIVIIGFEHMKNILLALSLVEIFKEKNNPDWDQNSYWSHSLMTAVGAKRIADDLHYPKSGEVFTAGLLHDLGLIVLQRYMKDDFRKIVNIVRSENMPFLEAEKTVLGFTHQEISEFLLERWNFPAYIIDAVLHHHNPSAAEKSKVLASLVHLVDYMTQKFSLGAFEWDGSYDFDENILDILGFGNREYLESFMQSYEPLFANHLETIKQ